MHDAHPTNLRPLSADFIDQSLKARDEMFFVGLIGQERNILTTGRMISCRAAEKHDSSAIGLDSPAVCRIYRWFRLGYGQPCVALGPSLKLLHETIVGG